MKKLFLHDAAGKFLGEYFAQENPFSAGEYLEPEDSTQIMPPQFNADIEVAIFSNGAWVIIAKPVTPPPPPLTHNEEVYLQIAAIENTQTPRRIRESVLGIDGGWLANTGAQIKALRASLT